jgi:hypothetical protein
MDKRIIGRVESRSVLRKISDLSEKDFFSGRRSEPGDVSGLVDPDDVFLVGQNVELVDAGNPLHRLNAGLVVDVDDALVQRGIDAPIKKFFPGKASQIKNI